LRRVGFGSNFGVYLQLGVEAGLFGFGFRVGFNSGGGVGFGSDFWVGIRFGTAALGGLE